MTGTDGFRLERDHLPAMAAVMPIPAKVNSVLQALVEYVKKARIENPKREGFPAKVDKMMALQREVRELRRSNDIK